MQRGNRDFSRNQPINGRAVSARPGSPRLSTKSKGGIKGKQRINLKSIKSIISSLITFIIVIIIKTPRFIKNLPSWTKKQVIGKNGKFNKWLAGKFILKLSVIVLGLFFANKFFLNNNPKIKITKVNDNGTYSSNQEAANSLYPAQPDSTTSQVPNANATTQPTITDTDPAHPVRFIVPALNIDAPVESLGLDYNNNIAVPQSLTNVGWYNLEGYPGIGPDKPSVFVGHYATPSLGLNAIFTSLSTLKQNDEITIRNLAGDNFTYTVSNNQTFELKNMVPEMTRIVSGNGVDRIEIITCSGLWDANTYTQRTVITAIRKV